MKILFFVFAVFISGLAIAQEESLVTIYANYPEGRGSGTGIVIKKVGEAPQDGYYGHILTAAHVAEGTKLETLYRNGIKSERATVVNSDSTNDVAIVHSWVPNKVKPIEIAETVKEGEDVFIYSPRGITKTKISIIRKGEAYADTFVVSGDSGAPVLNVDKKIVGVISGGSFWLEDRKLKIRQSILADAKEDERIVTWPTRMANVFSIRKIFK